MKLANTNGNLEFRGATGTTYSASLAMSLAPAGTLTLNSNLNLGLNGTIASSSGFIWLSNTIVYLASSAAVGANGLNFRLGSGSDAQWANAGDGPNGTVDTGIHRTSAGIMEINSGTTGVFRDLQVRTISTTNITFFTTNAAPAGFVVGTTVPAVWFRVTNSGTPYLIPGYTP